MADKQAITEILGKMGWAFDNNKLDYYDSVYTDDARFTISMVGKGQVAEFETKATIIGLYTSTKASQNNDHRRHVISNIFFTENTATSATVVSYMTLFLKVDDAMKLLSTGEYTDQFTLVDGQWKIKHRHLMLDTAY